MDQARSCLSTYAPDPALAEGYNDCGSCAVLNRVSVVPVLRRFDTASAVPARRHCDTGSAVLVLRRLP